MKKFMKALALALALCMVLSVSAFAVSSTDKATIANKTTRTVTFTIQGLGDEQVALLVLKTGKTPSTAAESDILYIDQKPASGGSVTFEAAIAEGEGNDVVDVYVGSTSISAVGGPGNGEAWDVYSNVEIAETSSITFVEGGTKILAPSAADAETVGTTTTGTVQYGVAIKMNVNNLGISKMIWAFGDGNDPQKKVYSKPIILGYVDAQILSGDTWFTAAVAPSIVAADGEEVGEGQLSTLATVNAIFLDSNGEEHFTDVTDKKE